ncbi:trichohyalin isoform X3 [Condylostylus longicornis]|uniref:trichohyalin isoform X3 n=1 Tax=Condylostylus longicornis TaxID=2530218 RepID=UPI00244E5A87|nr:trichohyalin isoform X3 [Condylostylus longicornis]
MVYLYLTIVANYVSLPGAGGAEPTIIETLNKNTIINTTEEQKQNKSENKEENQSNINDSNDTTTTTTPVTTKEEEIKSLNETEQINLDNNKNQSDIENIEISKNILDIQSHLIETFDKNFSVSEDSDKSGVTVKEIPAKPEEFQTTSQIETETSPKSVIEIEPSIPKTHKPIQLDLDISSNKRESKLLNSFDKKEEEEEDKKENNNNIIIENENLNKNIKNNNNNNIINKITDDKNNILVDTAKEVKIEISNKFIENEKDKIESSHIENNNNNNNILANNENIIISDISSSKIENNINEKLIESEKQQNLNENHNNIEKVKEKSEEILTSSSVVAADNQENNFEILSGKQDKLLIITDLSGGNNFLNTNNHLNNDIGINGLKNCTTPLEEEEKQKLLDSLPQLDSNIDPYKLAIEAKKEYYQSLRDYLDKYQEDKPPIPLQTYRWEDIRRAKEKGGYPWTHLYKRPLGPDEEPEIVLLLRKSQEFTFHKQYHHNKHNHQSSESPKSLKKVRIHDQVLVKETERYISDLSDTEELSSKASSPSSIGASIESEEDNKSALSESCASDSVSEGKKSKFSKLKGILKRKTGEKKKSQENKPKESIEVKESTESKDTATISSASPSPSPLPSSDIQDSSDILSDEYLTAATTESDNPSEFSNKTKQEESSPKKGKCCHPIMDKIKNMADKQLKKRSIKKIPLKGDEKIVLEEQQKILKLRESPKADRSEIPKFVEKQDSEEIVEIVQLEESPSSKRKEGTDGASILIPDEIIEIPPHPTVTVEITQPDTPDSPPRKTLRKMKEHVYEEIDPNSDLTMKIDEILQLASVEALKKSLAAQDENILKDIQVNKKLPLDRMGSSEEEVERSFHKGATLAPISSIDSTSSDEQERRVALSTVAEESDAASVDEKGIKESESAITVIEEEKEVELKPVLKKEPSPGPNGADKKVTFSHIEDESEPLREDIEVPEELKNVPNRWKDMADHEYEPIGEPQDGAKSQNASTSKKESTPQPSVPSVQISQPMEVEQQIKESAEAAMELLQKDLEDRYLSSATTTPRSESRTDTEIRTSQVDTSALEELPLKPENRRKGLLASAQDRSRRFKAGIRNQAGKVKTKVRGIKKPTFRKPTLIKKETVSKTEIGDVLVVSEVVTETKVDDDASALSEPKNKKRFKAPDFSNIKMPDMPKFKSPDMSKLKAKAGDLKKIEFKKPEFKKPDFKRPEFTKVDMSKFKIPEKFSSLKLKRSRSFKEGDTSVQTGESGTTPESAAALQEKEPAGKKKFDFTFGTYPRALRRKKIRDSIENIVKPTDLSTQPSTETPPSVESSQPTVQRGTRDKGPVGSRWADKFSDVSYGGDSESGRFQRYGSEIESFERESSVERRMKDDLIAQEEAELALISDPSRKQFVEFDEENREIHKISRDREAEFKHRRPMIHQDSNLSEESRDVGWSDKDVLRNKMLQRAEMESESYSNNYPSEEGLANHETQSTGSSTKKGVIEEIDDDEFFLRKRGISQDNIEIRQYISSAIREGFDNPINTLQQLGSSQGEYPDSMIGISSDNVDFGYNIPRTPPRKPKRQKQQYNNLAKNVDDSQEISQEFDIEQKENYGDNISLPQTGSDFFKNIPPNRPLRRSKKGFQQDSQSDIPYFEEIDKDFYQHKEINLEDPNMMVSHKYDDEEELQFQDMSAKPIAPKRRKKRTPQSEERDLIMNGFGGRSVSNTYLEENIPHQDMIVYRTEHEYVIPLAKPESYEGTPDMNERRSTSRTNNEEDDRTSRGAESFIDEALVIMESGDNEQKFRIEMEDSHGYAVVRKEPPPRPPPPSRQKKSPSRFSTMPLPKKSPPPERPKRNYSTIAPDRPPRRPSLEHSEEPRIIPDATQYEELDIEENLQRRADSPLKLKSGEIINKMKYRPLPPPPRPPREKRDKSKHKLERDDFDDHDGEGERIATEAAFEVEISTQTDPLPDDFVFEEFEITDDMKIIEPRNSKTLEDILKEDDKEMEGVKWNGDDNLTRGIQRFRESTQRSFSEKSRASSAADRSKSHSRPQTPAAIVVEKRVPTPIPNSRTNETMLEASLTVQPIDDHDFDIEENITKTSLQGDGSFNESVSYQASTVKSVGEHSGESYEEERLMDFAAEEQLVREEEEREKLREEMRKIQKEKEEEEERLIMEKIRELQRMEEEEERKTIEKLKELEILEQQEKRRLQKEAEEEERRQREEQDRRILEKIKELERQEEEDRRIMEKLRQLEKEFSAAEEAEKQEANLLETEKQETVKEGQDFIEEQEIVKQTFEAPSRPPRKRPSVPNIAEEDQIKSVALETTALAPVSEKPIVDISTVPSQTSLPSHMALADLEVERLRVHALQAGHIMVSNLQGSQISADELECKGGNLVVRNLELPPGFIEDIVERVRSTERTHVQVETQTVENDETQKSKPVPSEKTESRGVPTHHQTQHMYEQRPFIAEDIPPRPPLPPLFPSEYMHSIPPAAFYQLRNPDDEEYQPNLQAPRRRRHYRRRDSSSDDDHHRRRSRSRRSPEPTVAQLGGQFLQACGTSLLRRLSQVANAMQFSVKEGGERNIGILIAMFILMTLGFLLMAMSGKNIHHHHWDFFNPPNNEGRRQ